MKSITDILSSAFDEVYTLHGKPLESVNFNVVDTTERSSSKTSYLLIGVEFTTVGEKTVNVNGVDIPEPMRVAPEIGCEYFVPHLESKYTISVAFWMGSDLDRENLEKGLCYHNPHDAAMHAKALLWMNPNA